MTEHHTDLPYIGLDAIESNTGEILSLTSASEQGIRSRSKVFRRGDVLYGRLRAYLNKVVIIESSVELGTCSGEFYVMTADISKIDPRFLRWSLSSDEMVEYVKLRLAGATHPRLSLDDLLSFRIRVPSLDMQKSAVSLLKEATLRRRKLLNEIRHLPQELSAKIRSLIGEPPVATDP
jgi:restriction endonuclease S subunit